MKPSEGRINKLYPELTARERAVLVLRALKEGKDEDPRVRSTMPESQVYEFNRYIDLMNGAGRLAPPIVGLSGLVDQLALRFGWLRTLDLWALHVSELAHYIAFDTKEPITEGEYARRVEAARVEMVPVEELAELLGETHEDWGENDLTDGEDGERVVSEAAWERFVGDKKKELTRLVVDGVLLGPGKGARLKINAGSFYDWLGQRLPVWPDWGFEFDVLPDAEKECVERLRRSRERAHQAVLRSPSVGGALGIGVPDGAGQEPGESGGRRLAAVVEGRVRREAAQRWRELVALETALDEIATAFGGEGPLPADVRAVLKGMRDHLEELTGEVEERLGAIDRGAPDPELLLAARRSAGLPPSG